MQPDPACGCTRPPAPPSRRWPRSGCASSPLCGCATARTSRPSVGSPGVERRSAVLTERGMEGWGMATHCISEHFERLPCQAAYILGAGAPLPPPFELGNTFRVPTPSSDRTALLRPARCSGRRRGAAQRRGLGLHAAQRSDGAGTGAAAALAGRGLAVAGGDGRGRAAAAALPPAAAILGCALRPQPALHTQPLRPRPALRVGGCVGGACPAALAGSCTGSGSAISTPGALVYAAGRALLCPVNRRRALGRQPVPCDPACRPPFRGVPSFLLPHAGSTRASGWARG